MIDHRRIHVVVPAKDEARFIAGVVSTMPTFVDEVVVVDDGSADDTGPRARAAGARVIRHAASRGVGAAIVAGYRDALARGAEVVAVMAGDGQMDPAELVDVVAPVVAGRAGYVKGHRLRHPEVWRRMPWIRLLGNATLGALTSLAIGVRIGDAQCGYTAVSREALEALDLDGLWPGYGYPNDLLAALTRAGVTLAEVPVSPIYAGESSGLRPRHFAVMLWLIGRAGYRRAQLLRRKKAANAAR